MGALRELAYLDSSLNLTIGAFAISNAVCQRVKRRR